MPIGFTHALAGLETSLFGACVAGSILALIAAMQSDRMRRPPDTVLVLTLLFTSLVRPEGVVVAGLCGLAMLIYRMKDGHSSWRSLVMLMITLYVIPLGLYVLWKWG